MGPEEEERQRLGTPAEKYVSLGFSITYLAYVRVGEIIHPET